MEDTAIIDLYWARSQQAIAASEEKYGSYCHTIARRILDQEEDAEECVNDTWLRAWNAMPPQRPGILSAFFGKLTRNLSLDRWRRARAAKRGGSQVEVALHELEDCLPDTRRPDEALEAGETAALISAFLRRQPEADRALFVRRYFHLEPLSDLAERFGMTTGQVKSRLHRMRQRLKAELEREGGRGMNTEYLLDAIGLLDDDLIQEAEGYRRKKPSSRRWMGLAASFAVVIALGYGAIHLWPVGSNNTAINGEAAGNQGAPSSSAAGGDMLPPAGAIEQGGEDLDLNGGAGSIAPTSPDSPISPEEQDYCAAIMVDGVLYWSTGEAVPVEVEESAIEAVTGYTSGVPEMDGQTNFSQDLSARYAMIDMGLVVLMDGEWIRFEPVPPWKE